MVLGWCHVRSEHDFVPVFVWKLWLKGHWGHTAGASGCVTAGSLFPESCVFLAKGVAESFPPEIWRPGEEHRHILSAKVGRTCNDSPG